MSIQRLKELAKRPLKSLEPELEEEEPLGWVEFDADETAGLADMETETHYMANGETIVTIKDNRYMVKGQGRHIDEYTGVVDTREADRAAIIEARRKRSAELKEEALNKELRELNEQWGSW